MRLGIASRAKGEVLDTELGRPGTVTYAMDVRVDQHAPKQHVEIASLKTSDTLTTLAFHLMIVGGNFSLGEYTKVGAGDYAATPLAPITDGWHRLEMKVVYGAPAHLTVRVDAMTVLDRDSKITFAAVPAADRLLAVGVHSIVTVEGTLGYAIDNVTVLTP